MLQPIDVVTKRMPPGVLIWPYHDVPPDADYFVAANLAAMTGVYVADDRTPDFDAEHAVTDEEIQRASDKVKRLGVSVDLSTVKTRRELVMRLFPAPTP